MKTVDYMLSLRKERRDNLNITPLLEIEDALASVYQCGEKTVGKIGEVEEDCCFE